MLVLLRNVSKLDIDNPSHLDVMKAVNDAGLVSYWHEPFGIVFSVEHMPRNTVLGIFEALC
jgi:hypothetical protein